jgi:hypothetical protein
MQEQTDSARDYANHFINNVVEALPNILGALIIILIGYIVAKIIAGIVRRALTAARLNEHLRTGKGGNFIQRAIPSPSGLIASITYWVIFLFAISVGISALGIPALVEIVNGIYSYLPNVIAAFLIFMVASAVSAGVSTLVANTMGDTPTGKVMATGAPVIVMGLATFMILNQLKIAPEIVTITYAGLVGTATLAFGLGGKDAASRMFMELYETGQRNRATIAADMRKGSRATKSKTRDIRDRV